MSDTVTPLPPYLRSLLPNLEGSVVVELASPSSGSVHDLGGEHPLTVLHGGSPSDDTVGLAVVCGGRVVDSSRRRPSAAPGDLVPGAEVWLVHLVWRDGSSQSGITAASGIDGVDWSTMQPFGPATGLVPDAMHRALDLATPAPSTDTTGYWTLAWLVSLVGLEPGSPHDALRWHPGVDPREVDPGASFDEVVALSRSRLRRHAATVGWESIRRAAASGWLDLGTCSPELAQWVDVGSFSRWIETGLVSVDHALAILGPQLAPDTRALLSLVAHDARTPVASGAAGGRTPGRANESYDGGR
jgi:hypothetical protein